MSRIRDKLRLLHKPLSTPRPDVENFPSNADVESSAEGEVDDSVPPEKPRAGSARRSKPARGRRGTPAIREPGAPRAKRDAGGAEGVEDGSHPSHEPPVVLSSDMRERLDRLMKVESRAARATSSRSSQNGDARGRASQPPDSSAAPSMTSEAHRPSAPVHASGGFTVSQRAFDRWRKERVDGQLSSPVVVREELKAVKERRDAPARIRSKAEYTPRIAPASKAKRPSAGLVPRPREPVGETARVDPRDRPYELSPLPSELERGDRQYFDAVSRLGHLSADEAIRQVLDALESGVSDAVRVHAFRTLASLAEEVGSPQYAIAAYDSLSTLCPDDPLPHRELYRLYRYQPDGARRSRFHLARARSLAPWDGRLKHEFDATRATDGPDGGPPFDA